MRRKNVVGVLAVAALFAAAAACGGTDGTASEPVNDDREAKPTTEEISYKGPRSPGGSEWVLRSLDGDGAAGDSGLFLTLGKRELSLQDGCMSLSRHYEMEEGRLRPVEPNLRVVRFGCDESDGAKRRAEAVLGIVRDLAEVRVAEDGLRLRSGSGATAVFGPPPALEVDPALVGTEWTLTSLDGREPLPGQPSTLEIRESEIVGYGACNGFGGAVDRVAGGNIEWSQNPSESFAATTVGCGGAAGRQEMEYEKALVGAESYRLDGDRLELRDAEGDPTLVFEREVQWSSDPTQLVGAAWVLRSIDGKEPVDGSVPTVRFLSGKEISWYDGCQNFRGTYSATENDLEVPNVRLVGGECMKPEAYADPDGPCVVACFGPGGDYRLSEEVLEIRSESGESTAILGPLRKGEELEQRGTPWELRAFVENGKTTRVAGGAPITLTFDGGTLRDEGTVFGSTGCNDYRVAYEHPVARNGPDRLVMGEPVVTRGTCVGPLGDNGEEDRFIGILGDVGYDPDIVAGPGSPADVTMSLETEDGRKLVFAPPE